MSYQSAGAWPWDLFEATLPGIATKPARAVAGSLLGNSSFFVGKVIKLSVLRNNLAAQWPKSKTAYPLEAAIKITRSVNDALSEFNRQVGVLFARNPFAIGNLFNLAPAEMRQYSAKLGTCISSAKRAGSPVAVCPNLRAATLTAFTNIIAHYDTLGTAAHELDTDIMLRIEEMFAFVGELVVMVGRGIKDNFPDVPGLGGLAELVKWGSIGGGLFILYWYVLRPADKRQRQ